MLLRTFEACFFNGDLHLVQSCRLLFEMRYVNSTLLFANVQNWVGLQVNRNGNDLALQLHLPLGLLKVAFIASFVRPLRLGALMFQVRLHWRVCKFGLNRQSTASPT